jgi:hypothetical protein
MKCPKCNDDANVVVAKLEYIYPELFGGLPTFWRFMSPMMARVVTVIILLLCIVLAVMALVLLSQGQWLLGLLIGLATLFSLYIFVACVKGLGKVQIKESYKCNACGLEWSRSEASQS